ncbi:MAG: serine/threonine protein kinase [Gemmataceae bacterium]|nr:serine/threonine protein kinase [Gemmataceae bacterium]
MADIGELIGGYKMRALLQTGQSSQVFEVVEPHSNRHFAMKLLLPEKAADEAERAVLFHEAEVGVKLTHPNVIRILKVNRDKKAPHFIMEFFPSGSLRLRLQAKDHGFVRKYARKIFRQAATGLAYVNASGYVHRDVKPDNILVNPVGETKIIDFAITKRKSAGGLFRKKVKPQGTPSFMSPEQIKGDPQDGRADVYSFGCTLYELTTGKKPFTAASQQELLTKHFTEKPYSPVSHNKDLTDEFGAFVLKMLAKKREDRFPGFHEVLIALQKIKIYKDEKPEEEATPTDAGMEMGMGPTPAARRPAGPEPEEEPEADTAPRPTPPPAAGAVPFDPDNIDIDSL